MKAYTIGHSTRSLDDFIAALESVPIEAVADIRRFPRSRRHPQFNAENLAPALEARAIVYRPFPALGGRRAARKDGKPSPNTFWREAGFRNFADYAETEEFRAAFSALKELAAARATAIMCAEAAWWRCHRRIVADYLIVAGFSVEHIFDRDKREAAVLTPRAEPLADGTILYSGAEPLLL